MGNHLPIGHFSNATHVFALIIQPHSVHSIPFLLEHTLQIPLLSALISLLANKRPSMCTRDRSVSSIHLSKSIV